MLHATELPLSGPLIRFLVLCLLIASVVSSPDARTHCAERAHDAADPHLIEAAAILSDEATLEGDPVLTSVITQLKAAANDTASYHLNLVFAYEESARRRPRQIDGLLRGARHAVAAASELVAGSGTGKCIKHSPLLCPYQVCQKLRLLAAPSDPGLWLSDALAAGERLLGRITATGRDSTGVDAAAIAASEAAVALKQSAEMLSDKSSRREALVHGAQHALDALAFVLDGDLERARTSEGQACLAMGVPCWHSSGRYASQFPPSVNDLSRGQARVDAMRLATELVGSLAALDQITHMANAATPQERCKSDGIQPMISTLGKAQPPTLTDLRRINNDFEGMAVRVEAIAGKGLGVVAQRPIAEGETTCYYFTRIYPIHSRTHFVSSYSHARPDQKSHNDLFEGSFRGPGDDNVPYVGPYANELSEDETGSYNVKMRFLQDSPTSRTSLVGLIATRDVREGEEIVLWYGEGYADWRRMAGYSAKRPLT